jgi:antitoxin component YwqK of YwqJK toxin-antitoxin module
MIMKTKIRWKNKLWTAVLMLALLCLAGVLYAQDYDDDKALFQAYKLPETALPDTVLVERDSIMYLDGNLFTGTAFSRFADGSLQHSSVYVNGRKHGTTFVWYPDGKPQLMATYRNGYLNGRFKGWYQYGGVIYDLVMKEGKYTGDSMYEGEASRAESSSDDSEKTADSNEGGND